MKGNKQEARNKSPPRDIEEEGGASEFEVSTTTHASNLRKFTPQQEAAFEELQLKFIFNLPQKELESMPRLFFQIEQAHWYYEDFLADQKNSRLPHISLYDFGAQMFSYCKLLQPLNHQYKQCYEEFASYKSLIPTSGCILLNEPCDKVLLVQNWKKTCWGFPKGKVNENEDPAECAMREVDEEIGYCPQVNRDDCIVFTADNGQTSSMYIVPNVPEDFHFEPRARKEISKIEFFYLNAPLPNERFNSLKYKSEIAKWIKKYKKRRAKNASSNKSNKDGQMAESVSSLFGMGPSVVAPRAATTVHDSVSDSPKSVIAAVQTSAQADNGGKFTFKLDDMFAIPAN